MTSLFGIESSVGATSPRCPLDRLLFFTLWSDRTIGSSEAGDATVFTYAMDFFLLKDWAPSEKWLDRGRTGVGRIGVGRTGVTGWLDLGCFGVLDLHAREAAAAMPSSSDPASASPSTTGTGFAALDSTSSFARYS